MKKTTTYIVTGIAWFLRDQWTELKSVVSDPEELEATYDEWETVIRDSVPDLIDRGVSLVKVPVDVNDLVSWCRKRRKSIDADARAQYVAELLQQRGASSFTSITIDSL